MADAQIARATISGIEFTLYYDYDEPLTRLYGGKTPAFRALNSLKAHEQPPSSFVIPAFSVLLNGLEALGSFLIESNQNRSRFYAFIETYMKSWNKSVANSPYPTRDLKEILWKYFRNGIAHGFRIEGGGIDNEADRDSRGWHVVEGRLLVGPYSFFNDFRKGVDAFLKTPKRFARRSFCDVSRNSILQLHRRGTPGR